MTRRSESRGIMYTTPPEHDIYAVTDDETEEATDETETEIEERDPAEPTPSATDANWTGAVPADD